jgi:isocitrate dehydrogenase (NAD+)
MTGEGNRLRKALDLVFEKGEELTPDLGGQATTDRFTDAVIAALGEVTT